MIVLTLRDTDITMVSAWLKLCDIFGKVLLGLIIAYALGSMGTSSDLRGAIDEAN